MLENKNIPSSLESVKTTSKKIHILKILWSAVFSVMNILSKKTDSGIDNTPIILKDWIWKFKNSKEFKEFLIDRRYPSTNEINKIKLLIDINAVFKTIEKLDLYIQYTIKVWKGDEIEHNKDEMVDFLFASKLFANDNDWKKIAYSLRRLLQKDIINYDSGYIFYFIMYYREYLMSYKKELEYKIKELMDEKWLDYDE